MKTEFFPLDVAEYLETAEDQDAAIADALEEGDPKYIAHVLGTVARARVMHGNNDMANLAAESGLSRAGLYKTLSKNGNPRLSTLLSVLKNLGLELKIQRIQAS